ncbi:hypothetical protein Droror1_Dr00020627 [Drosera rotundifolia]
MFITHHSSFASHRRRFSTSTISETETLDSGFHDSASHSRFHLIFSSSQARFSLRLDLRLDLRFSLRLDLKRSSYSHDSISDFRSGVKRSSYSHDSISGSRSSGQAILRDCRTGDLVQQVLIQRVPVAIVSLQGYNFFTGIAIVTLYCKNQALLDLIAGVRTKQHFVCLELTNSPYDWLLTILVVSHC